MSGLTRDILLYWGLAALALAACFSLLRRFEAWQQTRRNR